VTDRPAVPLAAEPTSEGEQSLVPGVPPVSARERIESLMQGPLRPRVRQKPPNLGLFDEDARRQLDLF